VGQFIVRVVVNAVAVWIATLIVPGVSVEGDTTGQTVLTLLLVGLIFGLVNAVVKPVVVLFSLPFYVLTLGLFAFVVNALMLELVSWLSGVLHISFTIDDFFWSAIGAAVVVTFASLAINVLLPDPDD